ncbi:MAG: hypothetical protein ACJA0N_002560 [Pseudohongiellaceae bacterium]|jgi:hypothetical protein
MNQPADLFSSKFNIIIALHKKHDSYDSKDKWA